MKRRGHERRVAEENDMGRRNRTLLLCCMVGAFWLWGAPLLAAGQRVPIRAKSQPPMGTFR